MAAVSPEWLSELGSEAPTEAQWELIERVFFAPRGFFADQTDARAAAATALAATPKARKMVERRSWRVLTR